MAPGVAEQVPEVQAVAMAACCAARMPATWGPTASLWSGPLNSKCRRGTWRAGRWLASAASAASRTRPTA